MALQQNLQNLSIKQWRDWPAPAKLALLEKLEDRKNSLTPLLQPWKPRDYQQPLINALNAGKQRAALVWHRQAGKDVTVLNWVIQELQKRTQLCNYFFPTYSQAKRVMWDGVDDRGFRILDYFPPAAVEQRYENELKIRLTNGSIWQLIGTDNMDANVGTRPRICVFSEYALQDPRAWNLMQPVLEQNQGTAIFCYTPRGRNHGFQLLEMAKSNPEWFTQVLTVDQTNRHDGSRVISQESVERSRREGMSEDLIQQEYYCSFTAAVEGNYYGKQLREIEEAKHFCKIPYDPALPVYTAWDLGVGDATAIWFVQALRGEYRFIDYYQTSGEGMQHYAKLLQTKPYVYADHIFPHDVDVRELGTGKSRYDVALALGIRPITVVPNLPMDDGISAVRALLPLAWFDQDKCSQGLEALKNYRKEYDEKRKEFKDKPYHDWTSHGADALRYFALGYRAKAEVKKIPQRPVYEGPGAWMG